MIRMRGQNKVIIASEKLRISGAGFSRVALLHQAAKNISLEGFAIKRIAIFENPLIAVVHLENDGLRPSFFQRLSISTKVTNANVQHNFKITIKLTDAHMDKADAELTYSIERREAYNWRSNPITIDFSNRLSSNIIRSVKNTGATIHALSLIH